MHDFILLPPEFKLISVCSSLLHAHVHKRAQRTNPCCLSPLVHSGIIFCCCVIPDTFPSNLSSLGGGGPDVLERPGLDWQCGMTVWSIVIAPPPPPSQYGCTCSAVCRPYFLKRRAGQLLSLCASQSPKVKCPFGIRMPKLLTLLFFFFFHSSPSIQVKHSCGFSAGFLSRLFSFFTSLPHSSQHKRWLPRLGEVALLKCEGLPGAPLVQTSVRLTKRGAGGGGEWMTGLCNGLPFPLRRSCGIVGLKDGPPATHKAEVWQD